MAVTHYQEPSSRQKFNSFPLFYLGVMVVFGYVGWLVVASVWRDVGQTTILKQRQAELDQMELELAVKERYVVYQRTDNYIEKQARQNFGYAKPGETVVILPQNKASGDVAVESVPTVGQNKEKVATPYTYLWWEYFFGSK